MKDNYDRICIFIILTAAYTAFCSLVINDTIAPELVKQSAIVASTGTYAYLGKQVWSNK